MSKRDYPLRSLLLLLPLILSAYPHAAFGGEIIGGVIAGFDSFTERYSIVEEDTLDRLTEFRTLVNLGYRHGSFSGTYFQLDGQSLIGQESFENTVNLNLMKRSVSSRYALVASATNRTYRESSSYSFPNDFFRYYLRAYVQRALSPSLFVRLTDRLEVIDFDQRTEFDYDFVRNHLLLSAEVNSRFTTSYRAELGLLKKSIPDSTEISYIGYTGAIEYRKTMGLNRQISLNINGERRVYANPFVKSPYWTVFSDLRLAPFTLGSFGLRLDGSLEGYFYDNHTDVFFDYVEGRSALLLTHFRSSVLTIGAGPAYAFFGSGFSDGDVYTEVGARVTADFSSGRLWLSATYEPGQRDYQIADGEGIFSDFVYHRMLAMATLRVFGRTNVNLFVNHEPENHKIEGDDSSTTLFSLDISYSF